MSYACTFRFDTASAGVEALRLQRRLAPANLVEGAHANRIGVLIVPHSPDRHQTRGPSPISAIGHQSVPRPKFVSPSPRTKSIFFPHSQVMAPLSDRSSEQQKVRENHLLCEFAVCGVLRTPQFLGMLAIGLPDIHLPFLRRQNNFKRQQPFPTPICFSVITAWKDSLRTTSTKATAPTRRSSTRTKTTALPCSATGLSTAISCWRK